MKSRVTRTILSASAITILTLCFGAMAWAQPVAQTNQGTQTNQLTALEKAITWDPFTKLAMPPPAAQWIAADWNDPGLTIEDISFDGLPLSEVARAVHALFKNTIDTIVPSTWQSPPIGAPSVKVDPGDVLVHLHLKTVHARELFNAMNLTFEAENAWVRWQLEMNGNRPVAILRVVPALLPELAQAMNQPATPSSEPAPQTERMVFFVGDLVSATSMQIGPGPLTMEQFYNIVCQVYDMGFGSGGPKPSQNEIKFHDKAQLLIVNATPDRIAFVQSTLAALRQKAGLPGPAPRRRGFTPAPAPNPSPPAAPEPKL